jgi:hypothetical protein
LIRQGKFSFLQAWNVKFKILDKHRPLAQDPDPVSSPARSHLYSQAWQRAFSLERVGAGEG